tara:strand:+ start:645 stop:893 length:249 start_codon:yes stop_codon:yes gene_type:complete
MNETNYNDDIRADDLFIAGDEITEWENACDMMDPEVAFGELWSDDIERLPEDDDIAPDGMFKFGPHVMPYDLEPLDEEDCPW